MKRIFILASLLLTLSASGFSQGEMDAFNLSYNDLTGTARSVSMGGAFGALGGDVSGVAINPAGIGVYKTSELVTTLNFTNTKTESNFGGNKADMSKFKLNFDNIGFVGVFPISSDEVPLINFGFAYNKLKSFNRKYTVAGKNLNSSLTDYIAGRANGSGYNNITSSRPYDTGADWIGILGYETYLIDSNTAKDGFIPARNPNERINSNLYVEEKGEISSYDFNVGTTISDILSIGATISVTDINYHLRSDYDEVLLNNGDDFIFDNRQSTEGSGWQVKVGAILKPINELRIGVAYHSPTWYNMTDYSYAYAESFWSKDIVYAETPDDAYDYKFRTPDKWVFSLAGIIGKVAILSADYELTDYSKMNLNDRYKDGGFEGDNEFIKEDFKLSSTLRLGAEIRITPQFSGRVGYMWQQSPVEKSLKDGSKDGSYTPSMRYDNTYPQYSIVGDANYFTWGLGYKFTPNFYTDVAFVIKNRTDDFYSYSGSDRAELKTNQFSGLMTLGYRF